MLSFRAASAEAVAALVDEVEGSASVADDLFAVAASLRSEGALRRFATDFALASEVKVGLVSELYDGKVDRLTLDLLKDAVARRWTRSRDLADALEYLGVVAAVRSSGKKADRVVDELFSVRTIVNEDTNLRNALSDRSRSATDKAALVDALLAEKALPATVVLVKQALAGTYRSVAVALEDYEKVAADAFGRDVATVRTARPLGDAAAQRLTTALTEQYGRPVHLNLIVDPDVIGGIRVEIGGDVIDGSIASRLDAARRKLAG
jgi:F-type H+-transporting ATPase subunit delta